MISQMLISFITALFFQKLAIMYLMSQCFVYDIYIYLVTV